jgi:hypothetical protein
MKKFLSSFLFVLILLMGVSKFTLAEETNVSLSVKNNGEVVYSGSIALLPAGTISINDSSGNPHDTNADSVLSVVNTADVSSEEFSISGLIYYDIFGAFYLKCVNVSGTDLCDNWQYKVNDVSPDVGMDSKILSGGENIVLYFGEENKAPEPEIEDPPAHRSSGSYIMPHQIIPPPETVPVPLPSPLPPPIPPEITPPSSNTNLGKKPQSVLPATVKKQTKKINKIAKQNTATVINSLEIPNPKPIEPIKKSWFMRLLDRIFSIF